MEFRPCIDIHNGKVKQIVGSSLRDEDDRAKENFVSEKDGAYYAEMYREKGLSGGHVILLNPVTSPYYEATVSQARSALSAYPGGLQLGGGVNPENAASFLEAGASHVIVTSYVFSGGRINFENLEKMVSAVGREHLVLDLSCRKKDDRYLVVTDRWQKFTDEEVTVDLMKRLGEFCDEFLIHAVDVEGKASGIETALVSLLSGYAERPLTYAGGIHDIASLTELKRAGGGRINATIGSALDIFGGSLSLEEVLACLSER